VCWWPLQRLNFGDIWPWPLTQRAISVFFDRSRVRISSLHLLCERYRLATQQTPWGESVFHTLASGQFLTYAGNALRDQINGSAQIFYAALRQLIIKLTMQPSRFRYTLECCAAFVTVQVTQTTMTQSGNQVYFIGRCLLIITVVCFVVPINTVTVLTGRYTGIFQ